MAIIDPDGLFYGDRLGQLSDEAHLHWPHIFLLRNGYGRFEVNYSKIIAKAYSTYQCPPTKGKVTGFIKEYADVFLLFLYKHKGQLWAQWDTSSKYLPRHKTAADTQSPAPDEAELNKWRDRYIQSKSSESDVTPYSVNEFVNLLKSAEKIPDPVRGIGIGVGIGIGIGGGVALTPHSNDAAKDPFGCRRFLADYPGEVKPDWDARLYLSYVLTAEDELTMFANLIMWRKTKKWQEGFIPSAENFLRKGMWKVTPKANAMGQEEDYPKEILK